MLAIKSMWLGEVGSWGPPPFRPGYAVRRHVKVLQRPEVDVMKLYSMYLEFQLLRDAFSET